MRALDAAIRTRLSGDATLVALATGGIHRFVIPDATANPAVVFGQQSGVPEYTHTREAVKSLLYLVKGVSKSLSPDIAAQIDARCRTLLQDVALTVAGYTTIYCRYDSDIEFIEEINGVVWQHVGALYRVELTA